MARTKTNPNPNPNKERSNRKLLTKVANDYLPSAVAKRRRDGITDDQADKDRYVCLWTRSKDRLRIAENNVKKFEEALSAAEPVEQYSNEVVSGDIESPLYWKAKWRVCGDRVRIAEKKAKLLQNAYIELCKETKP
jgi:hypothetical protein